MTNNSMSQQQLQQLIHDLEANGKKVVVTKLTPASQRSHKLLLRGRRSVM